jgi:hypothetical protein
MALAYRYAEDHGWKVPEGAHFWSLIGDSEFREGSLLEALPDVAERQLGHVTWIVDYNRQNLDGTRIPNERSLRGSDCDRIQRTAEANGWKVVQLRHGRFRERLFQLPGGDALREFLEGGLSDSEYQALLYAGDAARIRERGREIVAAAAPILDQLTDEEVLRAFSDLGGHDLSQIIPALCEARRDADVPTLILAHTIKGWSLQCQADPFQPLGAAGSSGGSRPCSPEPGLTTADPFARFAAETAEGRFLAARRDLFRSGIEAHSRLRAENRAWIQEQIERDGGIPPSLKVDLSLFPMAHTQWMWGQLAAKLVRIGTADEGGPQTATSGKDKDLSRDELRWKTGGRLRADALARRGHLDQHLAGHGPARLRPRAARGRGGPRGARLRAPPGAGHQQRGVDAPHPLRDRRGQLHVGRRGVREDGPLHGPAVLPDHDRVRLLHQTRARPALLQPLLGRGVRDHGHAERRDAQLGGRAALLEERHPDPQPRRLGAGLRGRDGLDPSPTRSRGT